MLKLCKLASNSEHYYALNTSGVLVAVDNKYH